MSANQPDPAWEKMVEAIDVKFGIKDHGKSEQPLPDRADLNQTIKFITFVREGRHFKLERVSRPAVIDRKTRHHRAAGSAVQYINIYDDEAITRQTSLYEERGGDWHQVDPDELAL